MANNLVTREELEVFTERVNESCPILEDARNLNKTIKGKKGGKIAVSIPDPGTTVVTRGRIPIIGAPGSGADITNTDINEFEKEFQVCVASNACTIDAMEEVTGIDSFEQEIVSPRCASVGAGVQADIVGSSFPVADSAYVAALGSSFDGFGLLSDMAGDLDDSQIQGELVGYMSGTIKAKIAKSGAEKFNAEGIVGELYRQAKIGEYANVMWKKAAMPIVETSAASAPSAITGIAGDRGEITVTVASGAKYPIGYAFKITGIMKKDVLGGDTAMEKVFILKEAVTASGTSAVFKVEPFSATGAHANVSRMPTTSDKPTALLEASKSYAVVWAFMKGNLAFNAVKLPSSGLDEVSAASGNGKVIMSAIVDGDKNHEGTYRFDAAYIGGAVDSRRAVVGYIKLA